MKCEKCKYCIQVSANEYKVRCISKEIAESPNIWVVEPSYCACYQKGSYANGDWRNRTITEQLREISRFLEENQVILNKEDAE